MAKVVADSPVKNQLLTALPHKEYKRLLPHLETVSLSIKEVLHEPYQPIKYVYFPENGLITKVVSTEDGSSLEVGLVGKEGMSAIFVFMGSSISPFKAIVQVPGEARRVEAAVFQAEVKRNWAWTDVCFVTRKLSCAWYRNRLPVIASIPLKNDFADGCSCRMIGWDRMNFRSPRNPLP